MVLFSLNPSYNKKFNPLEELGKRKSWEEYCRFRQELYQFFRDLDSKYYDVLWKLFSGLLGDRVKEYASKWVFLIKNLLFESNTLLFGKNQLTHKI